MIHFFIEAQSKYYKFLNENHENKLSTIRKRNACHIFSICSVTKTKTWLAMILDQARQLQQEQFKNGHAFKIEA